MSVTVGEPIASGPNESERRFEATEFLRHQGCSFDEAVKRAEEIASLVDEFDQWRTTTGSIPVVTIDPTSQIGGQGDRGPDVANGGASSATSPPGLSRRVEADPSMDPVPPTVPAEVAAVDEGSAGPLRPERPPLPSHKREASTLATPDGSDVDDEEILALGAPGRPQYRPDGHPPPTVEPTYDIAQFAAAPGELDRSQQLEIEGDIIRQWFQYAFFFGFCALIVGALHVLFKSSEYVTFQGPWTLVAMALLAVLALSLAFGAYLSRQLNQEIRHRKQERLRAIRVAAANRVVL